MIRIRQLATWRTVITLAAVGALVILAMSYKSEGPRFESPANHGQKPARSFSG